MARTTKRKGKSKPAKSKPAKARSARARGKASSAKAAKAVPASGPVTLDEARALARGKQPKLAAHAMREATVPAASPRDVGAERKKLRAEQRDERARRIREYKATMEIMKARGARAPRPKGGKGKSGDPEAKAGHSFQPLQILAEGDSWFKYPVPLFGGGIIPRLEDRLGVPILNLAKAGDEVRYMLGVEERAVLTQHLTDGSPAGGHWDVMLFSGGGNDIVDNPMALWVKDFDPHIPVASHINQPRFSAALALVRAGYEDLIGLRDRLSPGTHLIFHGYDFAIPDGRGICFLGPWLRPTFDLRKFPNLAAMQEVVKAMLKQFAAMLTSLASPNVTFINTQGTLVPQTASWHNELHPQRAGFGTFADLFQQKLKALFPARVA